MRRTRTLTTGALSGAAVAALLGLGAGSASAAATAGVDAGTLRITGDGAANVIAIALGTQPGTIAADLDGDGTTDATFDTATFDAVDIQTGGGDDKVTIGSGSLTTKAVTIDGGAGADTLLGGDGPELLIGGAGDDLIDGNRGSDTAQLGGGDDTFQWDPGDGSDVVDGNAGRDALAFHGSNANEQISLSANGARALLHRDVAAIDMDLGTVEDVDVTTLGGTDTVSVNDLTGTDVRRAGVDLASNGAGDGQPDRVVVNGTPGDDDVTATEADGGISVTGLVPAVQVTGAEPADRVAVEGGEGDDTVRYPGTDNADNIGIANDGTAAAAFGLTDAPVDVLAEHLVVAGGEGDDTIAGQNGLQNLAALTINGNAGNDTLLGGDGNDLIDGGRGDDLVDGNRGSDTALLGRGDDTFQWDPGDGSDSVEGQAGQDRLAFHGSNIGEQISLSANGARALLHRDVAAIDMDLGTVEAVDVSTLGGADTVTVNDVTGTDVRRATVDLASNGAGDGQPDRVVVNGTAGNDDVTATQVDGGIAVSGLAPGVLVTGAEAADRVAVDGGAGDDTVRYPGTDGADTIGIAGDGTAPAAFGLTDAPVDAIAEHLVVAGGKGDDTIAGQNGLASFGTALAVDGNAGNDTLLGSDGNDAIDGGPGNDLVDGNRGNDTALLGGGGDDTFQWDPGDGSDSVDGQAGRDRLAFHGSNIGEKIELSSVGGGLRLVRDVAAVTVDAANVENAAVTALGGADAITVGDLRPSGVDAVDVDLAGFGGGGDGAADTVTLSGSDRAERVQVVRSGDQVVTTGFAAQTRITGSEPAADALKVSTLGGRDTVSVDPGVSDLIQPLVDLGAGQ